MFLKFKVIRYLKPHKECNGKYVHCIFCFTFVVMWNLYWKQYDKSLYQQSSQFSLEIRDVVNKVTEQAHAVKFLDSARLDCDRVKRERWLLVAFRFTHTDKIFLGVYGTRSFLTVSIADSYCLALSCIIWHPYSKNPFFQNIYFNIFLPSTLRCAVWRVPLRLFDQNLAPYLEHKKLQSCMDNPTNFPFSHFSNKI